METQSAKISVYYECVRCGYQTDIKSRMERHYVKTNICKWKDDETKNKYKLDHEIYIECMKKKYRNADIIFDHFSQKQEESKSDEEKEEYKCNYCDRKSSNKYNIKLHEKSCKVGKIIESKKNKTESLQMITNDSEIDLDETKSDSVSNIEYTPLLCRFFEAMDISHISEEKHVQIMMFSSYEKIFTDILKNERNMNFYISLDSSVMMIYKNEINDVKKIPLAMGYSQICKNIHRYLINRIEMMKSSSKYNLESLKFHEKQIAKINKLYRFDEDYKDQFMHFLLDFCKEKKSMIFAQFTQNYTMNKEQLSK